MGNYVKFELLEWHWTIRSDFLPLIRDTVIPSILSDEDSPNLKVVRRKFLRDSFVFSGDGVAPGIFVKVHKYNKARERIKTLLLPSRARAEWKMAERMYECGLPVAEPLGIGERRSHGVIVGCASFQRAIPNCVTLGAYLENQERPSEMLKALGTLIRRMHTFGFRHPDLHAGNLLVETTAAPPKLWLADLHAASRPGLSGGPLRVTDLAKLGDSFRNILDESQFCEILEAYRPEVSRAEIGRMLQELLATADILHRRHLKSRSKRCLKTSGRFVVEKFRDKKIYRRREASRALVLEAIERHKRIYVEKGQDLVKVTPKSSLTSFQAPEGLSGKIFVKEYANRGLVRWLETLFYVHRGKRAWKANNYLLVLNIPCAEPIALVEERVLGLPHASYLIMEEIVSADRLDVFLWRTYFRVSDRLAREEILEKRTLVRCGAAVLRSFHAKKIYHKDLSIKNLLVRRDAGAWQFYCVDMDSIQFPWRLSLRRRIKNLAQLNGLPGCITTTDRIRFYKEYFGLQKLTSRHKTFLWVIRLISRSRVRRSMQIDRQIRKGLSHGIDAYEDIASL